MSNLIFKILSAVKRQQACQNPMHILLNRILNNIICARGNMGDIHGNIF